MERERREREEAQPEAEGPLRGGAAVAPRCLPAVGGLSPPLGRRRGGPGRAGGMAGEEEEEEGGRGGVMPRACVAARQAAARPAPRGAALPRSPRQAAPLPAPGSSQPRPERAEGTGGRRAEPSPPLGGRGGKGESLAEGV